MKIQWRLPQRKCGKKLVPFLFVERVDLFLFYRFNRTETTNRCARTLFQGGNRVGENNLSQPILVFGVCVGDIGGGFLKIGLAEFYDRPEAQVVASLSKIVGEAGLLLELARNGEPFEAAVGVLPRSADIASKIIAEVQQLLTIGFRGEVGNFSSSIVEEAVKHRDVDIYADRAVDRKSTRL